MFALVVHKCCLVCMLNVKSDNIVCMCVCVCVVCCMPLFKARYILHSVASLIVG